jgi:hypothetical protein
MGGGDLCDQVLVGELRDRRDLDDMARGGEAEQV